MARARTMPRHTAAPTPTPEGQNPSEPSAWAVGPEGQDLRESPSPSPPAEAQPATGRPETRGQGAHSSRGRQGSHKGRNAEEHHSMFEDRSVLDALWSAMVAAPTSVMSPPTSATPAALDDPVAPETISAAPEEAVADAAVTGTAPTETAAAPTGPAIGVAQAPTATRPPADTLIDPAAAGAATASPDPGVTTAGTDPPTPQPSLLGLPGLNRAAASTNRTIWAGPRHAAPLDWNSTSALLTIETPASITDGGLLVLRLVVGLTMAAHGAQKAFGAFGGAGLHTTAADFASLGYQPGMLFALAAVVGELFGGVLLTVGLLTPLAAGGIIGVTVNAMVAVNFSHGFFATTDGIELPLVLSGGALALLLAGPGRYAADARIPFFNGAALQCVAASVATFALLTSLAAHLL
jgi:putative oxidoreductase